MINVKWVGPVFDSSGYASATRSYLKSLLGGFPLNLTVDVKSFESEKTNHGNFEEVIRPHIGKDVGHSIQVTHLTPQNYPSCLDKNPNVYNVVYTTWETDTLPDDWVPLINLADEVWVPSKWNKDVFKRSGVSKRIEVIPHIIEPYDGDAAKIVLRADPDTFLFYSVFQWIERKNPLTLLRAYLTEFNADENVCLILKTYRLNTSPAERKIIIEDIKQVKQGLQLSEFPPISFLPGLLSSGQMKYLHKKCDCFVLPHRAEGFGIPHAEAMAYGKPVITTDYSGNLDFCNSENSYLIDSRNTVVCNMMFPGYTGKMNWGDPSVVHLKQLMRRVYENQLEAKKRGEFAKDYVTSAFSSEKIGQLMFEHFQRIANGK